MKFTPLNIQDPETYGLARQIAELTGDSLTGSVRTALRERLEKLRAVDNKAELIAKLTEIGERASSRPVLDNRSADEIIGYNEIGLFK